MAQSSALHDPSSFASLAVRMLDRTGTTATAPYQEFEVIERALVKPLEKAQTLWPRCFSAAHLIARGPGTFRAVVDVGTPQSFTENSNCSECEVLSGSTEVAWRIHRKR